MPGTLSPSTKVGVYVDAAYMYRNGGQRMRYDVLREFAVRDHAEPVRLNAYVITDTERAETDTAYRDGVANFHSALRDIGYKLLIKELSWYQDESGNRYGKANADLDLAVDALLQSDRLDRVLLATGDGDFVRLVNALQNKGCRVEVVGLNNVSSALRQEADMFISGFLIPNMIPMAPNLNHEPDQQPEWGQPGSRVRGWCYWHHEEQSYGFIRYIERIETGLWLTDTRHPESPYETAFFHDSSLPPEVPASILPNRRYILEFELTESDRGMQAIDIELASKL